MLMANDQHGNGDGPVRRSVMELPVSSNAPELRKADAIRALGKALQANLVQLGVEARRRALESDGLIGLQVPSPGAVTERRDALIDRHAIRAYSDLELHMRLREQWGAYCALCWLIRADEKPYDFSGALPDADMHCLASVETKIVEVHAMLWRLRHEIGMRNDADYRVSAVSRRDTLRAARIPLVVQGKTPEQASETELFGAACEHAGMLAALRWSVRPARSWGDPQLMDVSPDPFDSSVHE